MGVRWASRPDLGFPARGYQLRRISIENGDQESLGVFWLPDTSNWAAFAADAEQRRPAAGPYFRLIREVDLGFLLPIIRLVDPRTRSVERPALVERVAEFFGQTHRGNAELAWMFWGHGTPPELAGLMGDQKSGEAVTRFYQDRSVNFLLALALRFEYAVLLGLATDDAGSGAGAVRYEVSARWRQGGCVATSNPASGNRACAPQAPAWVKADRVPGTVEHPACSAWPEWSPPSGFAPGDGGDGDLPASLNLPRTPGAATALSWAVPEHSAVLIDHGPVLYRLSRHAHGSATAAFADSPATPSDSAFRPIRQGDYIGAGAQTPYYLDGATLPWPPLAGHYHYAVEGVDLLGNLSPANHASIRHHDDLAPPPPRVSCESGPVMKLPEAATHCDVTLRIDWDPAEDFAGPDAAEFRIAAQWTPLEATRVTVLTVTDVDLLHADVQVDALPGPADRYVGSRLSLAGSDFPILTHGTGPGSTIRVRKPQSRLPAVGSAGIIFVSGQAGEVKRVSALARRPAISALVASTVGEVFPGEAVRLSPAVLDGRTLPLSEEVSVYLHLLRATVRGSIDSAGTLTLVAPPESTGAANTWQRWIESSDPASVITGSPLIIFPPHDVSVSVPVPAGFIAGSLRVLASTADGTPYVASPSVPTDDPDLEGLSGNESSYREVVLSVRASNRPTAPIVNNAPEGERFWADSAADYAADATYRVEWGETPDAARYQVWRVQQSALEGATRETSDASLRSLAQNQVDRFELRSEQAFGTSWLDSIPGRAPTRVLYFVRAVGLNGEIGDASDLIGPVWVPDVRRPAAPNLLRAVAADPGVADRAILLEWTQQGDSSHLRFDVFRGESGADAHSFDLLGSLPPGSEAGPGGRFRFVDDGLIPGRMMAYRVIAVREALDRVDPEGTLRRDITGPASGTRRAAAIAASPPEPPTWLTHEFVEGAVSLSWASPEPYESIQLWRRAPDAWGYVPVETLEGEAVAYDEPAGASGVWRYQLRARLGPFEVRTAVDGEVTIP